MVSKLSNVSWPKGTFVETVKEWQKTMVLHYRTPRHQLGRSCRIQPRCSNAAHLLGREEPELVLARRADSATDARSEHGGQECQTCRYNPADASSPDSPVPKPKPPAMEVQSEEAPYPEEALRDHSQRCLEVLQGQRDTASHGFGSWARH